MFLVRPSPLPGESLSSWRQRCGLENGFSLFPRAPGEFVRSDSDLNPGRRTMEWLAEHHGTSLQDVARMTLASLDGAVLRFRGGASVPRWVLPLRYTRRDRSFGVPFCPECLREDAVPYFRLRWRLCLASGCARHGVQLVDVCNRCGHPSWPATSALGKLYEASWMPIHECPVCRFDLRHTPAVADKAELLPVAGEFFEKDVVLSKNHIVPASEFAAAAWCIAQLLLRNRSAQKIHASAPELRELVREVSGSGERSIEWLPIAVRRRLTSRVAILFRDWPLSLLTFSERCGLSAEHFSIDRQELPIWFESAIRAPLRRQVRGVTLVDVQSAMDKVLRSGKSLTKQAVADLLGGNGSKVLQETMGRRIQATSAELRCLLLALDAKIGLDQKRKSTREMLIRDGIAVLLAIALQREIEVVMEMSVEEVLQVVSECDNRISTGDVLDELYARLLHLARQYVRCRTGLGRKRAQTTELFFVCFRGGKVSGRCAQELLHSCMISLDLRLTRSAKVFWKSNLL